MTTEIKPSKPSAVRRFKRKRRAKDGTDLLIMALNDGCFYFNKIHHKNHVEWEVLDMMLAIEKGHWEEITGEAG